MQTQENNSQETSSAKSPDLLSLRNNFSIGIMVILFTIALLLFSIIGKTMPSVVSPASGDSMLPTLQTGDFVFPKLSADLERGDFVVAVTDNKIVKRVIGVPGDEILIKDGNVFINNTKIDEPYLDKIPWGPRAEDTCLHCVLGENEYYLLGDNRVVSLDSRIHGPYERINLTKVETHITKDSVMLAFIYILVFVVGLKGILDISNAGADFFLKKFVAKK